MLTLISSYARMALASQLRLLQHHCQASWHLRRGLLSAASACNDAWRARLTAPEFSGIGASSGLDLGNGLMRALDRQESVAAVDLDVYANRLDSFDLTYLPFFASVLTKFRATQECLGKLESTDHALVRCMMSLGQAELLVDWLRDKFTYGVFLDQYAASLLIDHLLEAGNSRLAALVAFDHALQDSPSDGWLCSGLMLLACAVRAADQMPVWCAKDGAAAASPDDDGAEGQAAEDADDDPDTKHVIVDYIRLPNYDGHFDLDEERLQLGHTLACLSRRILAEWPRHQSGLACSLIGLAAGEKPDQILALLRQLPSASSSPSPSPSPPHVSRSTVDAVDALLATAPLLAAGDGGGNRPGRRPRCDPASVEAARAAVRALPVLPDSGQAWHEEVAAFARRLVADSETKAAQQLAALYAQFEATRLAELRRHGDWLQRRRLFQSVKSQLDSLVDEQEALTAFDKATEIRYSAWLAPRTRAERRLSSRQVWDRDVANANRLLDEASEAARQGAGGAGLLRRSSSRKEKFKPLKE